MDDVMPVFIGSRYPYSYAYARLGELTALFGVTPTRLQLAAWLRAEALAGGEETWEVAERYADAYLEQHGIAVPDTTSSSQPR